MDSVKGLLNCNEVCYKAKVDESLMYNAKNAHSRFNARNALKSASTEVTLKRKLQNEVDQQCNKDERLRERKEQEEMLEQNEKDLNLTKEKALLKMKEAYELMETAQKMDMVNAEKKKKIEKKRDQIKNRILSSACQKAAKILGTFINDGPSTSKSDNNNNNLE